MPELTLTPPRGEVRRGRPGTDSPAAECRSVARLILSDFRNYAALRLEPDPRPVVLTGANGAGKTNLLEALSFLAPGRGMRRSRLSDVARRGGDAPGNGAWAVAARLRDAGGTVDIGTGLAAGGDGAERRQVRIDGEDARAQAALSEHLSVVWLTPHMDRLFAEGAASRRRFIDRLVFGFDAAHAGRVSAYEHAMRERARLLRESPSGPGADPAWLDALEDTMAARGVAVAAARREMAARLDEACARAIGPFPAACLAMTGDIASWLDAGPALEAEDCLRQQLSGSRRIDAMTGGAAVGPHRDDLAVRHREKDLPAGDCSTGEQKAVLIAIVLADVRLQSVERGSLPLLLLDEVAAHLDEARRRALFDEIEALGAQAWMTGTDAALFASLGDRAQRFVVADAVVTPA